MKLLSRILAASVLSLGLGQAVDAQSLKFSTVGKPNDPDAVAMREWAKYVEEHSDLKVDVFDSAQLVEQGKQGQALARGTIDAAYMSPAWISEQVPAWGVLETPYLLTGPDHICAFRQSKLWDEMVEQVEKGMDLRLLDAAYQGTRTLNLRDLKDVKTPADLKGMSIRVVPSPSNILMGEGLGGNPTPVPFSELYLALQTGTVDAEENPLTLIWSNKFYEVTKEIVNTRHKVLIQFPAFSERTWAKLTDEQRKAVQDGAAAAMASYSQNVIDQEATLQAKMEEAGMTFVEPDREAFRTAMLDKFKSSDLAKDWVPGMFEEIADMKIPDDCKVMSN